MTCADLTTEILALGSVTVRRNGKIHPIGAPKQRLLLARLLVARGCPISVARLCEELWEDEPPRDPVHALQARVSRLRSAVPELEIEQVANSYRLNQLNIQSDIAEFEQLRNEGTALLEEGNLPAAADRLRDAISLWRGPAFDGFAKTPALQAESIRLEKLWVAAMADRIDIDLALGNETEIIPELAALVEENPLLERFRGQLMMALYRDGQAQEALETFARARETFSEEFGIEPSGELSQIHLKILREEPAESLFRLPVRSRMWTPSSAIDTRPLTQSRLTSNDVELLLSALQEHRALLVTGAPGIGKTHLLRSVRAQLEAQHWHVPFLSATALSQATPLGAFAGIVDTRSNGIQTSADVIDSFAQQRSSTILLVDNIDMLDDSSLLVINQLINTVRVPVLLATRTLTDAPEVIQKLFDSGDLIELQVEKLAENQAADMAVAMVGGALTPETRLRILKAADGNPLRMREIVAGSTAAHRLHLTDHGWELLGEPTPSPRLAQLTNERFRHLDEESIEAAALVAIAGELPSDALAPELRRSLARTDVLALADSGWLRLADPMDREALRARSSDVLWNELTREAIQVLTGEHARGKVQAQLHAHLLALDLEDPVDTSATIMLAERALGAFDERLALRAATAVIAQEPEHVEAHRIAGVATSVLRRPEAAEIHFGTAQQHAHSEVALTNVALDRARHYGLRLHDAATALEIIDRALEEINAAEQVGHLQRARMRWMAVAGLGGEVALSPETPVDAASVMGLITVGVSGVITGPLDEAQRVLVELGQVSSEVIDLVPGGDALIALTEIMHLSYTGDLVAAQRRLQQKIDDAHSQSPESLGDWEYAWAFVELLSGDVVTAHSFAAKAVEHLKWRDMTGLLPAAQALRAASSAALGRLKSEEQYAFEEVPETAATDPKVVMLRDWTEARFLREEGRDAEAARTLMTTARWLLEVQHTYFAGMWAHYAVRTGHEQVAGLALLNEVYSTAGGGFLDLLLRHAQAGVDQDWFELDRIAKEAIELGLTATAIDTWISLLGQFPDAVKTIRVREQQAMIEERYSHLPALVLWSSRTNTLDPVGGEPLAAFFSRLL